MYQVHVFISHSWSYSGHYDKLAEWIFGQNWYVDNVPLRFCDYSVPRTNPILNASNDRQLREAIYAQIGRSHVVVAPTGMYASHSKWIQKELEGAAAYGKPVLAVNPWAAERKSAVVGQAAQQTVGWNCQPVINGIWRLYNAGRT